MGFCSSCCSFFFGCCGHKAHDPKGNTLVTDRSCTDKLMLLLFIAAWALSIAVISSAATMGGDPNKIINGIDMNGNICGVDSAVRDQPLAALVNPLTTDSDAFSVWTCVRNCNETKNPDNDRFAVLYGSTDFFGYCIPTFDVSASGGVDIHVQSQFDAQFDSAGQSMTRGMSDLANAWQVILMSAFFALFFSYFYMFLTKRFAGVIIWLCITLVAAGGFFLGWSFLKAAEEADSYTSARRVQAYQVAGYIFIALTSLFVLVILGLSSQIRVAVEVVKEGSRAINDMKLIIFTPILPLLMAGGYVVYWIYGALYIFSVSDLVSRTTPDECLHYQPPPLHPHGVGSETDTRNGNPGTYSSFEVNDRFRPLAAYWVFHLLWNVQFLVYFGYFIIAGAVCGWYFSLSDASGNKMMGAKHGGSRFPILASLWRTVRFHLGTIAFASLIIAIVQFIRLTVKYIERKTRSDPPNYLQKAVFCLIQCFLKCMECCLDKISKNALVWTAMWGDPFLSAACSSFALIWRNLGRIAAVHVVSNVILFIGKVAIAAMSVGLSALILANADPWKSTVSSAFVPCILIAILSYCVAWLFFLTFETVVDTVFLCYLVDAENQDKHGGAMFASKGLQQLVGKYQLRSAQDAEAEKKESAALYKSVHGKVQEEQTVEVVAVAPSQHQRAPTGGSSPAMGSDGHRHGWGEVKK